MILTIKKYDIITVAMAFFLIAFTINYINEGTKTVITSSVPVNGRVIVIDAGHGGYDLCFNKQR